MHLQINITKSLKLGCAQKISTMSKKITCMKENGQYTQTSSTSHCDIEKIKRQIDGAITNLQGGNYVATMNTLQNMKKEITYCR